MGMRSGCYTNIIQTVRNCYKMKSDSIPLLFSFSALFLLPRSLFRSSRCLAYCLVFQQQSLPRSARATPAKSHKGTTFFSSMQAFPPFSHICPPPPAHIFPRPYPRSVPAAGLPSPPPFFIMHSSLCIE